MATLYKKGLQDLLLINLPLVRNRIVFRGKPPGEARSLQQRLADMNYKDPELYFKVDIGFPHKKFVPPKEEVRALSANKYNAQLELLARTRQLEVPLNEVNEDWKKASAPLHMKTIAEHYGIYQDLFGDAYFIPNVILDISYKQDADSYCPVHRGNVIKPSQATVCPQVEYTAEDDSLWTLILTNPDGHLTEENSEYVHWFVGNIPGNSIEKGEVIWNYLQPFPPKGTGYHRYVFILYKQDKKMDYSDLKKNTSSLQLSDRTFHTLEFYRKRQDFITPAGLAFFQSDWDKSLQKFFHNTLNMKEPIFEYDFPPPYHPPQKWFPLKQAFNLYMDRYRDPKQIAKEYLLKKLSKSHPFKYPPPPLKYPAAQPVDSRLPSWLRNEIKKERIGWGRAKDY